MRRKIEENKRMPMSGSSEHGEGMFRSGIGLLKTGIKMQM